MVLCGLEIMLYPQPVLCKSMAERVPFASESQGRRRGSPPQPLATIVVYARARAQGSSWFPLHICGVKPTLPCTNQLKQYELLCGTGLPCLPPWRWRAIEDEGLLGCQREQGTLRGGKAGRVKDAITNLGDFAGASVVMAVVFRQDHLVQHRP